MVENMVENTESTKVMLQQLKEYAAVVPAIAGGEPAPDTAAKSAAVQKPAAAPEPAVAPAGGKGTRPGNGSGPPVAYGSGDFNGAMKRFEQNYKAMFIATCRVKGIPFDKSESLFQDVMVSMVVPIVGKLPRILCYEEQHGARLKSWLRTVFRNFVTDHLRQSPGPDGVGGTSNLLQIYTIWSDESSEGPIDELDRPAIMEVLNKVLEKGDPKIHAFLASVSGKSFRDIGAELGVSHTTAARWYGGARDLLLEELRRARLA